MDIDDIKQNLRGYIVQRFTVPADDVEFTDDVHLFDYGYVDSFGAVELAPRRGLPIIDAWAGMIERRWATPVGEGHVVLRGPAAQLLALIDQKVQTIFVKEFRAELEIFPSTIKSETLHRCNHFTSFPEHMDFVAHLKQDLEILSDFANACREDGWSSRLHEGKMSAHDFAVSPSC